MSDVIFHILLEVKDQDSHTLLLSVPFSYPVQTQNSSNLSHILINISSQTLWPDDTQWAVKEKECFQKNYQSHRSIFCFCLLELW